MSRIIVAGGSDVGQIAYRWIDPIRASWRDDQAPEFCLMSMRDALRRLVEGAQDWSGVLLFVDDPMQATMLEGVLDQVVRHAMPAIVVARRPQDLASDPESVGVLVEDFSCDGTVLSAELSALMRRQRAMVELAQEVRLATASAHGLAEELRHVHEELEIAASVQRDILPKRLPSVDGIETGLLFRPAGQVSGDIYDLCELDDGRVAFFVGDAVGHGVPAALLTMLVAHHLGRAQARGVACGELRPARVLHELNQAMCERQFSTPRFATAVYGLIEPESGRVTLAGAGHPAPMVVDGDGSRMIETSGPLLGIFEEAAFDEARFVLEDGQTLLLFSDGFESAFPNDEDADDGRPLPSRDYLRELEGVLAGGGAIEAQMERLARRIDTQRGSLHQADDLTAIAIRRSVLTTAGRIGTLREAA